MIDQVFLTFVYLHQDYKTLTNLHQDYKTLTNLHNSCYSTLDSQQNELFRELISKVETTDLVLL